MKGENVTHMYTEYLLFSFKEANAAICDNRGKPGRQWVNEVSQAPDGPVATRVEVLWGKGSGEHRKSSQRTAETHRQLRNLVRFWACLSLEFHQESFWKPQHLYDLGHGDLGVHEIYFQHLLLRFQSNSFYCLAAACAPDIQRPHRDSDPPEKQ